MGRHRRRSLMQFRAAVAQRDHQRPVNQLQHVRQGSSGAVVPVPQVVVHGAVAHEHLGRQFGSRSGNGSAAS